MLRIASFCLTVAVFGVLPAATLRGERLAPTDDFKANNSTADLSQCLSEGVTGLMSFYDDFLKEFSGAPWWVSGNGFATLGYIASTSAAFGNPTLGDQLWSTISGAYDIFAIRCLFYCEGYDDRQWWALAWIHAYDLALARGETELASKYLKETEGIWETVKDTWNASSCGGGVWWNLKETYKNAITNELFVKLAASIALRSPSPEKQHYYRGWAVKAVNWLVNVSTMINDESLINDGINLPPGCNNNGATTWTYNQGVILGGLADLYKLTNDTLYLDLGVRLSNASMTHLSVKIDHGSKRILMEKENSSQDSHMFKGVYQRNLYDLLVVLRSSALSSSSYKEAIRSIEEFVANNGAEICKTSHKKNSERFFGDLWQGPFKKKGPGGQTSGLDGVFAALAARTNLT